MSWSVGGIGKAQAVATSIEAQFAQSKCSDPEESVRQAARAAIAAALVAQNVGTVVKVTASGSQSTRYDLAGKPAGFTNQLSIVIEPQWGFVE